MQLQLRPTTLTLAADTISVVNYAGGAACACTLPALIIKSGNWFKTNLRSKQKTQLVELQL